MTSPTEHAPNPVERRLVAGLARHLNNHLASVVLGLDLVRTVESPLVQRHGEQMLSSALRASAICHQLLLYSQTAVSKPSRHRPERLLQAAQRVTAPKSAAQGISETWQATPALPDILCDETQILNALSCLITNAREAMPDGGILSVSCESFLCEASGQAAVGNSLPGPYVCFSVTDNGVGMEADVSSELFKPFFSTKDPNHWAGLGLAATAGVVLRHQGFVTVETTPRNGSRFCINLPALPTSR